MTIKKWVGYTTGTTFLLFFFPDLAFFTVNINHNDGGTVQLLRYFCGEIHCYKFMLKNARLFMSSK